jgi:MFS family permease
MHSSRQVANLYYNQPILIHLSNSFDVPYDKISNVPSLTQAGYAAALLLISPLGDLVKRRPLILLLCVAGALMSIGLATTNSLTAFEALSFIIGLLSVGLFPLQ